MSKPFRVGQVYRENRLMPVIRKTSASAWSRKRNKHHRGTLKGEYLICVLVDEPGLRAIFLDAKGTDYFLTKKDFNRSVSFYDITFAKKELPMYTQVRGRREEFEKVVRDYLSNPSVIRKYGRWTTFEGKLLRDLNEENDGRVVTVRDFRGVILGAHGVASSDSVVERVYEALINKEFSGIQNMGLSYRELALNESFELTDMKLVKEPYGKGVSVKFGDIEYRFISDQMESDQLLKRLQEINQAQGPEQARKYLDDNAIWYWNSVDGYHTILANDPVDGGDKGGAVAEEVNEGAFKVGNEKYYAYRDKYYHYDASGNRTEISQEEYDKATGKAEKPKDKHYETSAEYAKRVGVPDNIDLFADRGTKRIASACAKKAAKWGLKCKVSVQTFKHDGSVSVGYHVTSKDLDDDDRKKLEELGFKANKYGDLVWSESIRTKTKDNWTHYSSMYDETEEDNVREVASDLTVSDSEGNVVCTITLEQLIELLYGEGQFTGSETSDSEVAEDTQVGNVPPVKKDYLPVNDPIKESWDSLVGHAFEFLDGIFVVTDVIDGTIYLLGSDDETYTMTADEFEQTVIKDVTPKSSE